MVKKYSVGRTRRFYKKRSLVSEDYDSEDDEYLDKYRKRGRGKKRSLYSRRASARTGDANRLTIAELKSDAKKLMPIYELLEDSVAVEAFLKKRIAEFSYLKDKFSQMTVDDIVKYWDSAEGNTKLQLYGKIAGLYVEMKKIAKEVCKEIKQEYTSTLASKYTIESIMFIFRRAASGMKSMRGRARFGTSNKCPDILLSPRQYAMRKALKGIKVGSEAAKKAMSSVGGDTGGSKARSWKKCVTALEAICLDPNVNYKSEPAFTIHKKWGVKTTKYFNSASVNDKDDTTLNLRSNMTSGKSAVEAGVSGVGSSYLASTSSAKKLFY